MIAHRYHARRRSPSAVGPVLLGLLLCSGSVARASGGPPLAVPATVTADTSWARVFNPPGTDSMVITALVSGDSLFLGGGFRTVGGDSMAGVALYDGTRWSGLGAGIT